MRRSGKLFRKASASWLVGALLVALSPGCGGEEPSQTAKQANTAIRSADSADSANSLDSVPATDTTDTTDAADTTSDGASELAKRGERIYNVNCIACHHRDPREDGGLGPPIAGASYELLEARVLRATYPPGYTPKRDTRLMVPLAHLAPEIEALTVFLAQATPK